MLELGKALFKALFEAIQSGDTDKFYNSRTWRRKRKSILLRDNYECQSCKAKGRVGKGESVHHIKHLREFPLLALTDSNLVTLCFACHNEEHPEKVSKSSGVEPFTNEERWE